MQYPYYKRLSAQHNVNVDKILRLFFLYTLLVIGTVLFHATLQYKMQRLDEMSMFVLISYASATIYTRCARDSPNYNLSLAVSSSVCLVVWFTERHSFIHETARGILVTLFGSCFIYVFYGGAVASSSCANKVCEQLFDKCYVLFLVSLAAWLMDNVCCDLLQRDLPMFYIPYLNYLGTVWHLGTCLGIYYYTNVALVYAFVEHYSLQIEVRWSAFVLPYIVVISSATKKRM